MFFRRGVSRSTRFLQLKLWIFSAGAILALLGMGLQNDWLIGAAGIVLAVGVLVRLFGERRETGDEDPEADAP